ncbi:substrate-binding domain-containing protein [Leifsonia aquatica]|uniref:substrate-binding domain-containing protein n=1 Tax=Leifsonia aquatica TaxID=144185 RepID=UPI00384B20E9
MRLASRVNDTFGLLLRDSRNPAYGALLSSLQLEAQARGRELVTVTVSADPDGHTQLSGLRRLLGLRVAGLFVATGDIRGEQLHPFLSDVPVMRVGRPEPDAEIDAVSYDERRHAELLVDHLVGLGHARIGVVHTKAEVSYPEWVRGDSMIEIARQRGADVRVFDAHRGDDGLDRALQAVETRAITALMCPSDARQMSAMRLAQQHGVLVPGDLSITGCDGLLLGLDLLGLTTVRLPVESLATAAMERMVELSTTGARNVMHERFAGELVVGSTTGPAPRSRTGENYG